MPLPTNSEDEKITKAARRICELFRGRFSEDVARKLIEELGGEMQAVDFVLNEDGDVVSKFLHQNTDYVEDMRADSKKIASLLENGIEYEIRQFACADCTRSWWKKVPVRKQVSKCRRCHTKFEPVPQEKEWGWAKFHCVCSNVFHGFGEMGVSKSHCYQCGASVPVTQVLPPRRRIGTRKRSNKPHSCNGVNCHNSGGPHDDLGPLVPAMASLNMVSQNSQHRSHHNTYNIGVAPQQRDRDGTQGANGSGRNSSGSGPDPVPFCIHPQSVQKGRRIRTPSRKHISTGSTVDTFLSQGSIDTATVSVAFTLGTIDEGES